MIVAGSHYMHSQSWGRWSMHGQQAKLKAVRRPPTKMAAKFHMENPNFFPFGKLFENFPLR